MKGKNGTTSFLPERQKGGKVRFSEEVTYIPNKETTCLTKDQATQVYDEIEKNEPISIQIVSQEIGNEKKASKMQQKEEDVDMIENPYEKAITNINTKDENKIEQMINWSIFSDKLRYVDSSINETPKLIIRPLEENKHRRLFNALEIQENQTPDMIFEENKVKETYFDKYEGINSEISQVTRFDENTDLSTTYLDKCGQTRKSDERKYMTDGEILEKYINLDNSCLTESEKVQLRDMIYKYREVFSLRDEIGTCPNIEIDIDVTDKMPFFIRPYQVKEEDKRVQDKEMKRLCYLGIWKEGFSAYPSPVMLVSRKLTKDKRVVTDFRHLNTRIAKNNLAYPLVKDTFTALGNSKCEVLSVLDLKDAFH